MRNYISSDIFQYRGILLLASGKKLIFFTISCMMRVINCEGMTSSPHWNEYSWGLVKNCFLKIWEISKIHIFLISYPIFMIFVPFYWNYFSLFYEMMIFLVRISSLSNGPPRRPNTRLQVATDTHRQSSTIIDSIRQSSTVFDNHR